MDSCYLHWFLLEWPRLGFLYRSVHGPIVMRMLRRCSQPPLPLRMGNMNPHCPAGNRVNCSSDSISGNSRKLCGVIFTERYKQGIRISFRSFPFFEKRKGRKVALCRKGDWGRVLSTNDRVRSLHLETDMFAFFFLFCKSTVGSFTKEHESCRSWIKWGFPWGRNTTLIRSSVWKAFWDSIFPKDPRSVVQNDITLAEMQGIRWCRPTFVKTKKHGVGIWERNVVSTDGERLQGRGVTGWTWDCVLAWFGLCIITSHGSLRTLGESILVKAQCARVYNICEDKRVQQILPCHPWNEGYH